MKIIWVIIYFESLLCIILSKILLMLFSLARVQEKKQYADIFLVNITPSQNKIKQNKHNKLEIFNLFIILIT